MRAYIVCFHKNTLDNNTQRSNRMSRILVEEVIDKAKISPFHWRILFWCTLIIIFDGYDLVIYGVVLPILM